ncbi:MAG: hypothetical protein EOO43_08605 [Flavobacterium sp.]|nr:MAG: hypothetical protein EOO43_08605 [Flavobacterium sp.]
MKNTIILLIGVSLLFASCKKRYRVWAYSPVYKKSVIIEYTAWSDDEAFINSAQQIVMHDGMGNDSTITATSPEHPLHFVVYDDNNIDIKSRVSAEAIKHLNEFLTGVYIGLNDRNNGIKSVR